MNIMKNQLVFYQNKAIYEGMSHFLKIIKSTCEYLSGVKLIPKDIDYTYSVNPLYKYDDYFKDAHYIYYPKKIFNAMLIGIDSSIYPIAESKDGYIFVFKGAIVKSKYGHENNNVYKYGPAICYISDDTKEILRSLPEFNKYFSLTDIIINPILLRKILLEVFELYLIYEACRFVEDNCIIVIDGTLKKYSKYIQHTIQKSLFNGKYNFYLTGVSKKSKLFKLYPYILSELVQCKLPIVIKLNDVPKRFSSNNIDIYFGKFSKDGIPLRIDIPKTTKCHMCVFDSLYTMAYIFNGYPNVLRDAHITAKLSKSELLSAKIYIENKGAKFLSSFRIREILFGAYTARVS